MTELEAQKMVADAILLERAEQVLRRVYPNEVCTDPVLHTVVSVLGYQARAWRREAEHG